MAGNIVVREMVADDIAKITAAFKKLGWNKPRKTYEGYFAEQKKDIRSVLIAEEGSHFVGYVTIHWESNYCHFKEQNIPEIVDLNVLPDYRNQGVGSFLIKSCEAAVKDNDRQKIGIGVGLTADYGAALRLYVQLHYLPDGHGIHYKCKPVKYNDKVKVDDDLVLFFVKVL